MAFLKLVTIRHSKARCYMTMFLQNPTNPKYIFWHYFTNPKYYFGFILQNLNTILAPLYKAQIYFGNYL